MEEVKLFVAMYWQAISLALSLMAFIVMLKVWWTDVRYFFMRMGWGLPLVGRIARAGRSRQKLGADGWYPVESQLCGDFYRRFEGFVESPDYYDRCEDYLNKSEELGRSEKGFFLWALIVGLILLEAVGFAYVLAPFMSKNASSNEQSMLAWFIAFLLSIAAVLLTEVTGKEWHKNGLINKIREWSNNERAEERRNLQPEKNITLDKTFGDNDSPKYMQLLNRVPANATVTPAYKFTIVTLIYIVFLAVGAYLIRSYTLEAETTENVNQGEIFQTGSGAGEDPFAAMTQAETVKKNADALELPAEMAAVNDEADKQAKEEVTFARTAASKVTFIMLSIIYVMIQVVGIYFGYAFSLVGKESKKARHYTKNFNSSSELNNWLTLKKELVASEAENYLQRLQEKLSHRAVTSVEEQNAIKGGMTQRTFYNFVAKMKSHPSAESKAVPSHTVSPAQPQAVQTMVTSTPVAEPSTPVVQVSTPAQSVAETVQPAQVPASGALPPELADLDLTMLDDNELQQLASTFGMDLEALKRNRLIKLMLKKQQAGAPA